MALSYAKGRITWSKADVATTTYTVSGLTFQPKAIRFWTVSPSSADVNESAYLGLGGGFATSTSNRRTVGALDTNGGISANCSTWYRDDAVLAYYDGSAANIGLLDLNAINSDGFVLIVDAQLATITQAQVIVYWEAWGGSDLTNAEAFTVLEPATATTVEVNLSGAFQPVVAMLFGSKAVGASPVATAGDAGFWVGFTTGTASAENVVCSFNSDDGAGTLDTDGFIHAGECVATIVEAGGTSVDARAILSSFDSDGLTFNYLERAVTGRTTIGLAIKGGQWRAGSYTINGNTGSATATVSGLPFQPIGGLAFERGSVQSTADTAGTQALICNGRWISTSDRDAAGVQDEDGTANVEIDISSSTSAMLVVPSTAAGLLSAFDLNAINSDGFQVIVDTAGGVANEFQAYLTFASDAVTDLPYQPWMQRGPVLAQ